MKHDGIRCVMNHQHMLCLNDTCHAHQFSSGSRNGVAVDIYWNIWSLLVLKL